ncbi:hypothetical protein [Pseudomonas aeruginosa]|uniref:hypothetical protein n=1 Tax=Pseudomonas aeruginosa TaxID=287 RepID=UPI00191206DF|nr:hypothetical protein [Pseudomonas aeruginosa]
MDEIASLQARLDKLNAETARRKEIARQAAIRAANTYAMPANGSVVATAAGRGLIQVAQAPHPLLKRSPMRLPSWAGSWLQHPR